MGEFGISEIETVQAETDASRAADNPTAARRRTRLAREAEKGLRRAVGETQAEEDVRNRRSERSGAQS